MASTRTRPFANIRADLRAHGGDWSAPGFWALMVYRFGRWRYGVRPFALRKLMSVLYWMAFRVVRVVSGISLPCEVVIGRGLVIEYAGDIIVSSYSRIGDNCCIRSGVFAALIGNNVDVGAGARLLGCITVGDNVIIGANAIVTRNVADNSIVRARAPTLQQLVPAS